MSLRDPAVRAMGHARIKELRTGGVHVNGRRVKVPENINPLVKFVFHEALRRRVSVMEIGRVSGVSDTTIRKWLKENSPRLTSIEAIGNALGYDLRWVKREASE